MRMSITFVVENKEQVLALIAAANGTGAEVEGDEDTPVSAKKKPAKKSKDPLDMDEEETEGEEVEEETEEDEDTPAPSKKKTGKAKDPTVEDVIEAMQAYAEEHDRKAAIKKLAKYKVKSVHDLDEKNYPALLKDLKI